MGLRVFLTGGTGFVGHALVEALVARGDQALVLTRSEASARARMGSLLDTPNSAGAVRIIEGEATSAGEWQEQLRGVDAVVNLAGQSVGGRRWNAHYKQLLHDSRVDTTRYVVEGIAALPPSERPAVLVSASGIDYYGASDEELELDLPDDGSDDVAEDAPLGESALARICRDWEAEAREVAALEVRVALMRFGLVLGLEGALPRMARPFKWFVGGRLGKGRQWTSWIHLSDTVGALLHAIDQPSLEGPVNVVAPNPVRNRDFARALGKALGRPSFMPTPAFAIKMLVGEFSEYILHGRRAVPRALLSTGYAFQFPTVSEALADLYRR